MKAKYIMSVILASIILMSCNKEIESANVSAVPSSINDPLSSFEVIVKNCEESLPKTSIVEIKKNPDSYPENMRWGKSKKSNYAISYDLQKTDSLVSTHAGVISITYNYQPQTAESEELIKVSKFTENHKTIITSLFSLVKGRWTYKSSTLLLKTDPQFGNVAERNIELDLNSFAGHNIELNICAKSFLAQ